MTDIVKWLREQAANDFTCEAKLLEAADDIERLKANLYQEEAATEELEAKIGRMQKVLMFAAGYISTDPGHAHKHPDDILKWLKSAALEGE